LASDERREYSAAVVAGCFVMGGAILVLLCLFKLLGVATGE
jgi:hypothetical protein